MRVKRHALASFAGSTLGQGSSLGSVLRAFATRGASHDADGSGAPSNRRHAGVIVALVAFAVLALVPTAQAAFDVHHYWGNPSAATSTVGGQFGAITSGEKAGSSPGGVAVRNSNGDVYVADAANNRIERFSSAGVFKEAWGFDVVSSGAGQNNAIQSLTVKATAGQFKLTFGANTTADLAFNATAAQVKTALEALPSIGASNVTVTGGPGDAGGSVPYGIFFTGTLKESAQAAITTSNGTTPLSGGAATATIATINPGGATGYEICPAGGTCKAGETAGTNKVGGQLSAPTGVAIDQATGNIYVADTAFLRVQEFTADGVFIRAFGKDVVQTGKSGDAPAQPAKQTLTVKATGGTFKLTFQGKTTADLAFNATAAQVQTALQGLTSIGNGNATVSGGPGDENGTTPYVITFAGAFKESPQPLIAAANGATPLSGGAATATVVNTQTGSTGFEICVEALNCKIGVTGTGGGAFASFTGNPIGYPAVAPAGAPNAGNVLVPDVGNNRVQEFTAGGEFTRAFGSNVVSFGPDNTNGGGNEVQKVTVVATGGTFTLTFSSQTTSALPFNATAGEVQAALNALSSIGGVGASVSVAGGPGDATGSTPYVITFGGALAGTDVAQISVTGSKLGVAVGTKLTCTGGPTSAQNLTFQWLRNGTPITFANETTYKVVEADKEKSIQCQVTAINENAGGIQINNLPTLVTPLPGTAAPVPPSSIAAPTQSAPLEGKATQELTCNAGAWANSPTEYTYQWYRNGVGFGSATTTAATSNILTLLASEQTPAAVFQCMVTGKNAGGAASLVSANRATTPAPSPAAPSASSSIAALSSSGTTTPGAPGFEVCNASASDMCQKGFGVSTGNPLGQFTEGSVNRVAVDTTGAIYTLEDKEFCGESDARQHRVQKFSPSLSPTEFAAGALSTISACATSPQRVLEGPTDIAVDPSNNDLYVVRAYKAKQGTPAAVAKERRLLDFDSSGVLKNTYLATNEINSVNGLAVKSGGAQAYLTSTTGAPRVYALESFTPVSASIGETTNIQGTSATLNGTVNPAAASVNTTYRFEYSTNGLEWTSAPASDFNLGNGSGGVGNPANCPVGNPPSCEVSQNITGLRPSTKYFVRLVARSEFGAPLVLNGEPFVTAEAGPVVVTGESRWSSPIETNPSLLLLGTINPNSLPTTYLFQVVSQEAFEESGYETAEVVPFHPNPPADAGHGYIPVTVKQVVTGLDASKSYHYRLLASSVFGTVMGNDRTVNPPKANERFFEWVTAADSGNIGTVGNIGITGNAERSVFYTEAIGEPHSIPSLLVLSISQRTPSGWQVRPVESDPRHSAGELFAGILPNQQLTGMLWGRATEEECEKNEYHFYEGKIDGTFRPATPLMIPVENGPARACSSIYPNTTSANFNTIVFTPGRGGSGPSSLSDARWLEQEPLLAGNHPDVIAVVETLTDHPFLRLENVDNSGHQIGGSCGAGLGGQKGENAPNTSIHAISDDGSVVYFNTNPGAPSTNPPVCSSATESAFPFQIFKRVNGTTTVKISESTCNRVKAAGVPACNETLGGTPVPIAASTFQGASVDGSTGIISTTSQLTNSDTDATADVYIYDESPPSGQPKLVQVSAGEVVAGAHETVGSGAKATQVYNSSFDGSRTYFVAEGVLTGANSEGKTPTAGGRNLYVFERDDAHPTGVTRFVTELASSEGANLGGSAGRDQSAAYPYREPDQVTAGDGHILYFTTTKALVAEDHDSVSDMYVYNDNASGTLIKCVTCAGNGSVGYIMPFAESRSNYEGEARRHVGSYDGTRAVFDTTESLSPKDTNSVTDVYEWHDGVTTLISGATGEVGGSEPLMSEDGHDILFKTSEQLVASDGNTAPDLYDARIGGGFPEPKGQVVSCQSSVECHEPPGPTPNPPTPTSVNFHGPGNPPVQKPKKCGHGKSLKHGKCVKKSAHSKKHKRHVKRADSNRGGAK